MEGILGETLTNLQADSTGGRGSRRGSLRLAVSRLPLCYAARSPETPNRIALLYLFIFPTGLSLGRQVAVLREEPDHDPTQN